MMSEQVTPAIPEKKTYTCDKCHKQIKLGGIDAKIELMDRDYSGGVVFSHWYHLCQRCRVLFTEWLKVQP